MTEPQRPPSVPRDAAWDAQRGEWMQGHKDAAGRWHGLVTSYDAAGLARSRQCFDAGVADGPCVRLHPSGAEAYRATFVAGKLHGDARAVSSREPGAVPLRSCCVPPGAWALVTRYDHGNWVDQWFEDEAGRPLLADGALRPPRPSCVPETAQYDEGDPGWVLGECSGMQKMGEWRRWSVSGDLLEVTNFREGKLHGSARTYKVDRLLRQREYVNGVLDGPATEQAVNPSTFEDPRIRAWQGTYQSGRLAGRWTYQGDDGQLLFERDYGVPCQRVELTHPVLAPVAPDAGWAELGKALSASGDQALGLCARIRAAVAGRDAEALRAELREVTVALGATDTAQRLAEFRKYRERPRNGSPVQREDELGAWIQGLLEGLSPSLVLGQLGVLLLEAPRAGLDFVEAALLLEPALPTLLKVRAQLWFELGQPEIALRDAEAWASTHPEQARWVAQVARLWFPRFEFWPARVTLDLEPNPELPDQVAQPLPRLHGAIQKSALRLGRIRQALVFAAADAHSLGTNAGPPPPEPSWLPPDLSSLLTEPWPELERYEFVDSSATEDGNPSPDDDLVKVDEIVETDGLGVTALMRLARVEWTCLCWLCWGAGLERIALPDLMRPPAAFARALSKAFFQVFRVQDSRATRGLRSKARGLPAAHWEGLNVDALEPSFIDLAFLEAREMRAVLYWLGDAECRSLWQDDLRDV